MSSTNENESSDPLEEGAVYDDPFSPENSAKLSLVVNMRIYDALMAILHETSPESAERLNKIHEEGGLLCSLPWLDITNDSVPPSE